MSNLRPHNSGHHVVLDADEECAEVMKARQCLQQGHLDDAIALLEPLSVVECDEYSTFELLGVAYARKGNMTAAVGALETAARLSPARPENHYNLGQALLSTGDKEGAMHAFERALRVDQTYSKARNAIVALQPKAAV